MKVFFKFVGILVIIGFILSMISEDKTGDTKKQTTDSNQIYNQLVTPPKKTVQTKRISSQNQVSQPKTNPTNEPEKTIAKKELKKDDKEDKRLFRYKQCEEIHSEQYCYCLIGHVTKRLGFFDEATWLSGGALTDADAIKALSEAPALCSHLDNNDKIAEVVKEIKIKQEESQKTFEEKKQHILSYNNKFCNYATFNKLVDSKNKFSSDDLSLPVEDIELIELSGEEYCKIVFKCSWCTQEPVQIPLYFKEIGPNKYAFDVNQGTDATNTLYFMAAWIDNVDTVKDLINKGADVNYRYRKNEHSFFTKNIVMGSDYFDIVKLCVERGANINEVFSVESYGTIYTNTPLTEAVEYNKIDTAKLFLAKGANPNIPGVRIDENGQKTETLPIERTIPFSDESMSKLLLEHGAKIPEFGYVDGQKMPLVWAVMLDNPDNLVERLSLWLSKGADANAEFRFDKEIKIINPGGTIKRIKPSYKTQKPVEYAESNNMFDVVQLLQKYGAKPQYEITNLRWCDTDFVKQICGTLTNNSENTLKTVYLTFSLYDSDNAKIGEALAYTSGLDSKEKWKFKATGDTENAKTYKLREIKIYDF